MKKIQILILIILTSTNLFSQQKQNLNYLETILYDTEIFFVDGASFFTYPLRMNQSEWLTAAGLGLGTYIMVQNDNHIKYLIGTDVNEFDNEFWSIFENYGVVQLAEIAGVATYSVGLFSKNDKVRKLGRMIIQSLTYSGLMAMLIRMTAGRKRPPYTSDHHNFIGFTTNNSFQSFPSGHTTVAFALSTVLAEYFDSPWSRIGFYGLAGLAATERLINSEHWFTDIALGALVGIAGGIHVIKQESDRESASKSRLSIMPSYNGINFQYRLN